MLLIADSGSSKTDWCVIENSEVKDRFQTVGLNPYFWTHAQIREELQTNVATRTGEQNISEVHFYGAGCSAKEKKHSISSALSVVFKSAEVFVEHDLLAAARALCGNKAGVACILGTGSNSCIFDGKNIIAQPINLGFWLGDEGSGGFLGKSLIISYLHKEMPSHLSEVLTSQYAIDLESVLENAYQKSSPNRYFASFAPFVSLYAHEPYMQTLIEQNFNLFLEKYLLKLPYSNTLPVHFVGSVAYQFQEWLCACVEAKSLTMGQILQSPMRGLIAFHQK